MSHSRKLHICGIGGTAMVAGARLALEAGWEVRGSDGPLYPPASEMAAELGVRIAPGYAPENLDWNPDIVLIGNVLSRGNPEVEAVLARRLRYMSLPEWMKEHVLRERRAVAICGTHGKTTTTALSAHVLAQCGLDPGYLIGGQPLGFAHPARLGPEGVPFVIEGDEYDTAFFDKRAKFLHYLPEIAVVTSVEFDHGDIYRDLEEIKTAFERLLRQIPGNGWLVACADNAAAELVPQAYSQTCTYGFHPDAAWRGELAGTQAGLQLLKVFRRGVPWGTVHSPLTGRHNLQNVLAAIAVADAFGAAPEAIAAAIASFPGVRRRMEIFLEANGVTYVDDFAHHPTAIRETVAAARARWPEARLRVLFEPRSNTTVTNQFQAELAASFTGADEVWLGPLHRAESIAPEKRLNRPTLVAGLRAGGIPAQALDSAEALTAAVQDTGQPGDVVLILSNGAFGGIYALFRIACEKIPQASQT